MLGKAHQEAIIYWMVIIIDVGQERQEFVIDLILYKLLSIKSIHWQEQWLNQWFKQWLDEYFDQWLQKLFEQ